MNKPSTLRPGLLVAIKTSLVGNVSYNTRDIEREHNVGRARVSRWETERTVADADEHAEAIKVRSTAVYTIRRHCATTAFGCLCPEDRAETLSNAIAEAHEIIEAFNQKARITRLRLYVITGRVAPDDVEAVRAIRAELAGVIGEMERGVTAMTPAAIRDASRRAIELSEMLTEKSKARVKGAVEAARAAATAITKAAKAGEQAACEVDKAVLKKLAASRTAFLDLDEDDAPIAAPKVTGRSLDLESAGA